MVKLTCLQWVNLPFRTPKNICAVCPSHCVYPVVATSHLAHTGGLSGERSLGLLSRVLAQKTKAIFQVGLWPPSRSKNLGCVSAGLHGGFSFSSESKLAVHSGGFRGARSASDSERAPQV